MTAKNWCINISAEIWKTRFVKFFIELACSVSIREYKSHSFYVSLWAIDLQNNMDLMPVQ